MSDYELSSAPDEFIEEVKQALDQLYNYPFLQRLPLAYQLNTPGNNADSAGKNLRRELIHAIEGINPGSDIHSSSPDIRLYNLLNLHYIGRMPIKEVALELGISDRQGYRDLKRGQVMIAEALWVKFGEPVMPQHTPLQTELALLKTHIETVNLKDLLHSCLQAVERLAEVQQVEIQLSTPDAGLFVSTNTPIAQQLLINLLSYSVKQASGSTLRVVLEAETLHLSYPCTSTQALSEVVSQLASQLQWQITQQNDTRQCQISLHLLEKSHHILVIDDNEGIVELLQRYLAEYPCNILSANSSLVGLEHARQLALDAIILDVMMPEVDGWELLQRLRSYPETEYLPIIICSVLYDPELAYSLGASAVIAKPVTQSNILSALHSLNIL